jgi:GAF domain-containing protein
MNASDKQKIIALAGGFMSGAVKPDTFYRSLTEQIVSSIGCSRASLWQYTSQLQDRVVCLDLYDSGDVQHHAGAELTESDFGPYFHAMQTENIIIASHARQHPATSCFNELYLEPNGIHSLLDVGINVGSSPFGLFCCEQVTFVKEWTTEDVEFLRSVGTLCGMAFKKTVG